MRGLCGGFEGPLWTLRDALVGAARGPCGLCAGHSWALRGALAVISSVVWERLRGPCRRRVGPITELYRSSPSRPLLRKYAIDPPPSAPPVTWPALSYIKPEYTVVLLNSIKI